MRPEQTVALKRSIRTPVTRKWGRIVVRALACAWLVFWWCWLQGARETFVETDSQAYWGLDLRSLYEGVQLGDQGAFLYSPLIAQIFAPFSAIPYEVFYGLLAALNITALAWMLGVELAALAIFVLPISNEIARGNIHLLMAAAIVAGFRYPAAWAWILLTKVTPGIGLLWFAFRGEWRRLAIAGTVTGALVAVSLATVPQLWLAWIEMLAGSAGVTRPNALLQVPVVFRLPAAALLLYLGAWRRRPAIVPVAALLALPAIWINSLSMLVAVVPIWRQRSRTISLSQPEAGSVE